MFELWCMGIAVCVRCMARELERVGGVGTGSQRAGCGRGVAVRRGCCVGRLRCG